MNRLTDKHFSFKCPMNWDSMQETDNGRFCGKCRKEVFDLTNCSLDEVRALQQKHGSICGSIRVMGAAAVAISLSTAACQKENRKPDSVRTTGEIASPSQCSWEKFVCQRRLSLRKRKCRKNGLPR